MIVQNQDKLNEALKLLEFTEDIATAWNPDYIDISENTLFGFSYLTSLAREMIEEACGKKEVSLS